MAIILQVAIVNQLARQLLNTEHPNAQEILQRQNHLNDKWQKLQDKAEAKKNELGQAHRFQTFKIDCGLFS